MRKSKKNNNDDQKSPVQGHKLKIVSVIIAVALIVTVFQCGNQFIRLSKLKEQRTEYQVAYDNVVQEQQRLEEQRKLLENDTYLKRLSKERFGLIKPDEYVVLPGEENDEVKEAVDVRKSDIH